MKAEKENEKLDSRNYQRRYYVEGNTARKLDAVPQRIERPQRRQEQERKSNPRSNRNVRRALAFDLRYTLALLVATSFLFVSCVSMLSVQADITEQRRKITMLERNLTKINKRHAGFFFFYGPTSSIWQHCGNTGSFDPVGKAED